MKKNSRARFVISVKNIIPTCLPRLTSSGIAPAACIAKEANGIESYKAGQSKRCIQLGPWEALQSVDDHFVGFGTSTRTRSAEELIDTT